VQDESKDMIKMALKKYLDKDVETKDLGHLNNSDYNMELQINEDLDL
jgi:hypothetical protein